MTADDVKSRLWLIDDPIVRDTVKHGVNLLTDELGNEWPDKINQDILDMSDTCDCVIGQVFKCAGFHHYRHVLDTINVTINSAWQFGFDVKFAGFQDQDNPFTYANLTDAWRTVLGEDH